MNIGQAYEILGVSKETPLEDIKRKYKTLVKEVHPDRGGDEDSLKRVVDAYESIAKMREEASEKKSLEEYQKLWTQLGLDTSEGQDIREKLQKLYNRRAKRFSPRHMRLGLAWIGACGLTMAVGLAVDTSAATQLQTAIGKTIILLGGAGMVGQMFMNFRNDPMSLNSKISELEWDIEKIGMEQWREAQYARNDAQKNDSGLELAMLS